MTILAQTQATDVTSVVVLLSSSQSAARALAAEIVREKAPRDIVFSVECGTVGQAERSIAHLRGLLAG